MASGKIRFLFQFFGIAPVNENRFATGGMATVHVPPAVADHPTLRQINVQFARDAEQHSGLGLATIAVGQTFTRMKANFHTVNRQLRRHVRVDFFDDFLFQGAAANIGLVRGDDKQKISGFQFGQSCGNFRENFKLCERRGRKRFSITLQGAVDDTIAVKKNCAPHFRFPLSAFRFHFVDSHFVCATFNLGCDTNKCQMTA